MKVTRHFDLDAERSYYKDPPRSWKASSAERAETLMRFTAGTAWVNYLQRKTVLELGAGECLYLPHLLATGKPSHYIASDIFQDRFESALKALYSRYPNLEFRVLRADEIEMPDNSFDTILAFGLYHHMPDLTGAFREAWRVLKPGGILILRDPYAGNPTIFLKYWLLRRSKNEWPLKISSTQRALNEAGFFNQRVSRFWLRFPRLPEGLWSTNIGFVAKKAS